MGVGGEGAIRALKALISPGDVTFGLKAINSNCFSLGRTSFPVARMPLINKWVHFKK